MGDSGSNSTQHEAPAILAEDGDLATTYQRGGEAMMVPLLPDNPTGARRRPHDCIAERCDTDTRTPDEIEFEGWTAALTGADYDDVPYGHTHPDARFSPWQRGRWKALGVWCDNHRRPFSWCVQEDVDGPCSDRPLRVRPNGEPTVAEWRARCLLAQSLVAHRLDTADADVAAVLAVLRGDLSLAGVE